MAKTIRMMCLMQENSFHKSQIQELEKKSKALYSQYFGNKFRIVPVWIVIPSGQAYLAGKPSTTTTVTIPVADNTSDEVRHAYMARFCQMWMEFTGCDINEIIFNCPDKSVSDEFMEIQMERIHPGRRKLQMLKMVLKMVKSKIFNGYFSANMNLNR